MLGHASSAGLTMRYGGSSVLVHDNGGALVGHRCRAVAARRSSNEVREGSIRQVLKSSYKKQDSRGTGGGFG